jgi:fluoroquinolone resistance protein
MPRSIEGERFHGADAASLELRECSFEECTFDHVGLQSRDLCKARFVDCTFDTCDLAVADVTDCAFVRVKFRACRLSGIHWSVARKLEDVSFEGSRLADGSFLGVNLERCDLTDCDASNVSFRDAKLVKAKLRGADLTRADIANCDLRDADLRGAHGYVLDPRENRLEGARFSLPEAVGLLRGLGILLD